MRKIPRRWHGFTGRFRATARCTSGNSGFEMALMFFFGPCGGLIRYLTVLGVRRRSILAVDVFDISLGGQHRHLRRRVCFDFPLRHGMCRNV
ncbi:hypothetical protein VTN49DRAFT_4987 [Thermomyces lanuginosus]|uniref:uncharacterized protein n=1 Tax=Thermomyces lanuginosus TaxID=5541 RepID=UPI003744827E